MFSLYSGVYYSQDQVKIHTPFRISTIIIFPQKIAEIVSESSEEPSLLLGLRTVE